MMENKKLIIILCIIGFGLTIVGIFGLLKEDCPATTTIIQKTCPKVSVQDCIQLTRNAQEYLDQIKQEVDIDEKHNK